MLKKLTELLPISRRKHFKTLEEFTTVLQGLIEAEANHCQIETNIVQQLQLLVQKNMPQKPTTKKNGSDPAFQ